RNWLVQGNTMEGNRRGITLYYNATTQVAIVGNTLTNSGSIDLTPVQGIRSDQLQFIPMYTNQIVGNTVSNTDRSNGVFIGVHTVQHGQAQTFGTSVVGLEVRGNTVTAGRPNVPAIVDAAFPEGYLNYLEYHPLAYYVDEQVPAILGSVFENNTAVNCDNGLYLNTGSYGTVSCSWTLVNSANGVLDTRFDRVAHGSVGTATCSPATTAGVVSGATYSIVAKHSGKALDVTGSATNDGAKVVQWPFQGSTNEKWVLTALSNAYYSIKAVHSGKVLSVSGGATYNGVPVVQWSNDGSDSKQFKLVDAGEGYYYIVGKQSQKYLDISGISMETGALLQQWTYTGADNQKFRLSPLSGPGGRLGSAEEGVSAEIGEEVGYEGGPLVVYPNPAVSEVSIEGGSGSVVTVVDMRGQEQSRTVSGSASLRLDVSSLAPGQYIVVVKQGQQVRRRTLVISH
ncbi:RICIN domain-containing protein, partial [Spirosoma flavum]